MPAIWLATVLILISRPTCASNDVSRKEVAQLLAQSDNFGKDAFQNMTKQQRQAWGKHASLGLDIMAWKSAFTNLKADVLVNVVLIHFGGGGKDNLQVHEADLARYLNAIKTELPSIVLQPEVKNLAVKPRITFKVMHGSESVKNRVDVTLRQASMSATLKMREQPTQEEEHSNNRVLKIPYQVVDDVIRREAQEREGAAFTIYLLNPSSILDTDYLYTYGDPAETEAPPPTQSCPGTLWSSDKPYLWIDVAAGLTAYGPGLGHKGQVFEHTMPHSMHFKDELYAKAVVPEMAALVWSACRHLVWPPVKHLQMSSKDNIEIVVVHMHQSLSPPPDRLSKDILEKTLKVALSGVQSVTVKEAWVSFADCHHCINAYSASIKELRSREDQTLTIYTSKKNILDSLTLHSFLQKHEDDILDDANLHAEDPTLENTHMLPVFVFNMGSVPRGATPVLLDGQFKAVAFSDMVIAVTSEVDSMESHFTCGYSYMKPSARQITREVLAALLTAGWGVADTSTFYTASGGENRNYLWSVGNDPFSVLSDRTTLSAVQQEGAHRNVALASLNASIVRLQHLLEGFEEIAISGKLDRRSVPNHQMEIMQRLDLALFKVQEATRLMGMWHSAWSHVYLKSLLHDVDGLELLARKVNHRVTSRMTCEGVTNIWSLWWAPASAIALWPCAIYLRRRIHAPKVEKVY